VGGATVNWETDDGSPGTSSSQTNAQGIASTTWTLGTTAGSQSLVAGVSGASPATFEAVAGPGPPTVVVIIDGNDQTGTVGAELADDLVVEVRDEYGNAVGAGVSVSWQPDDGGAADPPTSETAGDGRASTGWTLGSSPGEQTLQAVVDDVGSVTFSATAEAGSPASVVVASGNNQTGTVGQALDNPLEVRVTDSQNNPLSGVTVTWTPASGAGSASPPTSQTNASGIASTSWTLGSSPGAQSLDASVSGVTPVTFNATAEAGAPDAVTITGGNDQTGTVGQALDNPLEVRVTDSQNNPLSGVTVTWTPASGAGSASPPTSQTNASGIASTSWTLGSSPGAQSLDASVSGVTPVTFSATAEAGAPDAVTITGGNSQTGTVGQALDNPLEVRVTDSQNNPLSGVTVTWTPASGAGSASPPTSQTNSSGIASTSWTLGSSPGAQSLDASVSGVTPVTFNATAEAGAPDAVTITGGNDQTGTVGQALDNPLEVRVTDSQNNPLSGVTVTWTPASGAGSASPPTSQTNASGIASTSWTLGSSPGAQSLDASVSGVTPVTFNATAEAGAPDAVTITGGNDQTGTVGQALDNPLEVRVTDSQNNPLSGVTVTWTPTSGGGSADPTTSQTNSSGIATTSWTLGSSPGAQSLDASVGGVAQAATFNATAEEAEPDNVMIESGNDQTGTVSLALDDPLRVRVTDSQNNALSGVTVRWAPASGDGSATPSTSQTNSSGVASTTWTLGPSPGLQRLDGSVSGVTPVEFRAIARPAP
jgi:adhesin/invasin